MRKLLILTANPKGSAQLRLGEEIRDISEGLERSRHRDDFRIVSRLAVRPRDLRRAVVEESPQMVHFSGHGEGEAGLYLEDESGNPQLVTGRVLSVLFEFIANEAQVECVVLNGCYSSIQAEAIVQHVPYVVGMRQAIGDKAAIEFAVGFYDIIWNGGSVESAFNSGKVAAQFISTSSGGDPLLFVCEKRDPSRVGADFQRKVLLLSASSSTEEDLYRKREISEIEEAIIRASLVVLERTRSLPILKQPINKSELKVGEILKVLPTIKPFVVDIFGTEDSLSSLLLEKDVKSSDHREINELIREFFELMPSSVHCVMLNGCYIEKQAREIVQYVEFLIGIPQKISQNITIIFLKEFYYNIGVGLPIEKAYDAACNRILKANKDKIGIPVLLSRKQERRRRKLEEELLAVELKIAEAPKNIRLRTKKGYLLEQSGEYEKAAAAYEKSLHIKDEDYRTWWKRGKALFMAGKYEDAKKPYENALSLNPGFSDEYVISREYGLVLELAEQLEQSLALCKKSLWLNPRYRAANYQRKKFTKVFIQKNRYSG